MIHMSLLFFEAQHLFHGMLICTQTRLSVGQALQEQLDPWKASRTTVLTKPGQQAKK